MQQLSLDETTTTSFLLGNRVGTGYFRNVGNTQRMGTELAVNGKLGKKTLLGMVIIHMLGLHLKLIKRLQVLDTQKILMHVRALKNMAVVVMRQLRLTKSLAKPENHIKFKLDQVTLFLGFLPTLVGLALVLSLLMV